MHLVGPPQGLTGKSLVAVRIHLSRTTREGLDRLHEPVEVVAPPPVAEHIADRPDRASCGGARHRMA